MGDSEYFDFFYYIYYYFLLYLVKIMIFLHLSEKKAF